MASPTLKRDQQHPENASFSLVKWPLFPKRGLAWVVEVSLVAMSGLIPYGIGVYVESHSSTQRVPLHPVLEVVEDGITMTFNLPRHGGPTQVPPLTNLFWGLALATPMTVTGWQLLLLAKVGRTLPKRGLGLKVLNGTGRSPGFRRILLREGVGKWGLPLGVTYILWRFSPLAANPVLFLGLGGIMVILEGSMLVFPGRRPFHDFIAGTGIVDTKRGLRGKPRPQSSPTAVKVEVLAPVKPQGKGKPPLNTTAIALREDIQGDKLPSRMRLHPAILLMLFIFGGMFAISGIFIGTQLYIQSQTERLQLRQQKDQAFVALVNQLSATSTDPLEERKSIILALGRLNDPRTTSLLVDLLGQQTDPSVIDTLESAISGLGIETLNALRPLNQTLSAKLGTLAGKTSPEKKVTLLRLNATQAAIAKLLLNHQGKLEKVDLSRVNLTEEFNLSLEQIDLSGVNFNKANLSQGSFRGSRFQSLLNSEVVANFSEANLSEADFSETVLKGVIFYRSNLRGILFERANLQGAELIQANLSSARLRQANLKGANLQSASLTGADLAQAQLNQVNLQGASLGQIQAVEANFSQGNLTQSYWQGADLSGANLSQANLQQADLNSATLQGTNLREAQLQNANLAYADLSKADLRGANLAGADFLEVRFTVTQSDKGGGFLKGPSGDKAAAKIDGVDFSEVKNLSPSQIEFICRQGGKHPQCSFR